MSDQLELLHARAGLDLLAADPLITLYTSTVPDDASLPYIFAFSSVSWPRDGIGNALTNYAQTVTTTWTLHCVAESEDGVWAMQMRARLALLNQRPVIAGRSCGLIKQDEVQAPEPDRSTKGRLVMDGVCTYSFSSTP